MVILLQVEFFAFGAKLTTKETVVGMEVTATWPGRSPRSPLRGRRHPGRAAKTGIPGRWRLAGRIKRPPAGHRPALADGEAVLASWHAGDGPWRAPVYGLCGVFCYVACCGVDFDVGVDAVVMF